MRISDWSSDVCSSDLVGLTTANNPGVVNPIASAASLQLQLQHQLLQQHSGSGSVASVPGSSGVGSIEGVILGGSEHLHLLQQVQQDADGDFGAMTTDRKSTRLNSSH